MPAFPLPLSPGETATIGGHAAEGLSVWLSPLGDAAMEERIGPEKILTHRADARGIWIHTRATRYCTSRPGEWLEGQRYLLLDTDAVTPVGVLNITAHHTSSGTEFRVSNAFVAASHRRQGIASSLLAWAKKDRPTLCVDSSLTELGAALTGQGLGVPVLLPLEDEARVERRRQAIAKVEQTIPLTLAVVREDLASLQEELKRASHQEAWEALLVAIARHGLSMIEPLMDRCAPAGSPYSVAQQKSLALCNAVSLHPSAAQAVALLLPRSNPKDSHSRALFVAVQLKQLDLMELLVPVSDPVAVIHHFKTEVKARPSGPTMDEWLDRLSRFVSSGVRRQWVKRLGAANVPHLAAQNRAEDRSVNALSRPMVRPQTSPRSRHRP